MKSLKVIMGVLMITASLVGIAAVKKAASQKAVMKKTAVKNTSEKKGVSAAQSNTKKNNANKEVTARTANPASVYCEEKGGESILVRSKKGDFGICRFKDGTAMEEWEYYRENN